MQCNQLLRLVKEWHTHVKQETMAPGRMMQFVDSHVKECPVCREDRGLPHEIEKIREYVLPELKHAKHGRAAQELFTPDIFPADEPDNDPPDDAPMDVIF
ncbi:hypothetical protein [Candidatus Electronema sp. PJ]|uniref:hypothetical protein n=1 Tax=Candidatus Electronema sp. PJ TaxID=3401572 RepID=UPI003AA932FE